MSIAEKLTAVAENQQKVYDAGVAAGQAAGNAALWQYVYALNNTFQNVAFPDSTELTLHVQNLSTASSMIQGATGLRKLTLKGNTKNGTLGGTYSFTSGTILELDFSQLDAGVLKFHSSIKYAFMDCTRLKYIRGKLDFSNVTSTANTTNMFRSCGQLIEVRFVHGSVKVDLSLSSALLLSDASIASIIDGLADLSGQAQQSLTLHSTVVGKLTDTQKAAITAKNWKLVY